MKLFLTSYRIPKPEALFNLVGKKPGEIQAAVIPNAKDYYSHRARGVKVKDTIDYLQNLGLNTKVIDLKNFSDSTGITQALQNFDVIWVMGGNTFCLRYEMARSGLDNVLSQILETESVVYAGESAGACVVGTSLTGLELADNPDFSDEVMWDGIGLVDSFILPHADNPWMQKDIIYAKAAHQENEIIALNDDQIYIVNDEHTEILDGAA